MRVKICGITNLKQAQTVYSLRPDALGVLVGYNKGVAPNVISENKAKQIVAAAPECIDTFLLTDKTDAETNISYCSSIYNKCLQLTGDISLDEIYKIKIGLPYVKIIKVIHVNEEGAVRLAQLYSSQDFIDELLLDSRSGLHTGGTGLVHDWGVSREIVEQSRKPVWLAGGLNPTNLRDAISAANPSGVDVETGVQNPDGSKNYELIKEFISIAKER